MNDGLLTSAIFKPGIKVISSPYMPMGTSWLSEDQRMLVVNKHDFESGEWEKSRVTGPGVGRGSALAAEFRECMDKCKELLKACGL